MLTRYLPEVYPMGRLQGEVDRLFEDLADGIGPWTPQSWAGGTSYPALNVWEDDQKLYAEAELPGLKIEDVHVEVCGNELTLKGERKEQRIEGATCHRRERGAGRFVRVIRLPVPIDVDKVEAAFHAGVLTITMPKTAAARARKIEVKSAS